MRHFSQVSFGSVQLDIRGYARGEMRKWRVRALTPRTRRTKEPPPPLPWEVTPDMVIKGPAHLRSFLRDETAQCLCVHQGLALVFGRSGARERCKGLDRSLDRISGSVMVQEKGMRMDNSVINAVLAFAGIDCARIVQPKVR